MPKPKNHKLKHTMTNEIKSFYDLEQSVKQTVQAYIQDNREDIDKARQDYIEDNGKIDGFFYDEEMLQASQTLANDFVMYYSDTWAICHASRFGTMDEMDYFNDAESQVSGCHDGDDYMDKCMTSIAYMIVERLCMEFFSEFLLVEANENAVALSA